MPIGVYSPAPKPKYKKQESNWMQEYKQREKAELLREGFIKIASDGQVTLTAKGKRRVANRLDRLPTGDEYLLQIAILDHHGVRVEG